MLYCDRYFSLWLERDRLGFCENTLRISVYVCVCKKGSKERVKTEALKRTVTFPAVSVSNQTFSFCLFYSHSVGQMHALLSYALHSQVDRVGAGARSVPNVSPTLGVQLNSLSFHTVPSAKFEQARERWKFGRRGRHQTRPCSSVSLYRALPLALFHPNFSCFQDSFVSLGPE